MRQRACRPSWLELPFRALLSPWPGIPGLLSWGWPAADGCPPVTCPPPLHRHHRRASTPGDRSHLRSWSDQLPDPVPSAWFLTTSTASSARRLAGLLRPAAGPGVRRVSDRAIGFPSARPSSPARPPLEEPRPSTAVTRSLASDAPLTFLLDPIGAPLRADRTGSRLSPSRPSSVEGLQPERRVATPSRPVPSWALLPPRGLRRRRVGRACPVTRTSPTERPPPLTGRTRVGWRRAGGVVSGIHRLRRRPATSTRFWTSKNAPESASPVGLGAPEHHARHSCESRANPPGAPASGRSRRLLRRSTRTIAAPAADRVDRVVDFPSGRRRTVSRACAAERCRYTPRDLRETGFPFRKARSGSFTLAIRAGRDSGANAGSP